MFLKVILYFRVFSFCSKCIFVFSSKNWFRGGFTRSSQLRASCEKCLREIKSHIFIQRVRDCIATKIFPQNDFQAKTGIFSISYRGYRDCHVTVSRLKASRKSFCDSRDCLIHEKRMFSTLYGRCDSFSKTFYFPRTASFEPFSTQNHFSLKPFHS